MDVEAIRQAVRANRAMQEDLKTLPDFESIPLREEGPAAPVGHLDRSLYGKSLDYVGTHYEVPYSWPFEGNRIQVFLKRLVRKAVKGMVLPLVAMQNRYNSHVMRCLEQSRLDADDGQSERVRLAQEVETLRRQVAGLQEQVRRLSGTAQ